VAKSAKIVTLSLPPEIATKVEQLMKEEGRTEDELLREALRRYVEEQEWKKIYRYGETKAKEKGITEDQVEDIVDAYRKEAEKT
jgi:CopG family transcriptional regulator/antitoxin EndoAI